VRPIAGSLGAEVAGVDLAGPLRNSVAEEPRSAFVEHLVLFFRDQAPTPERHLAVSRLFGPLARMPYVKHMNEHPDIIAVLKEADERIISTFDNDWHSDFSHFDEPPMVFSLNQKGRCAWSLSPQSWWAPGPQL
jgi:taurine dioxygenase